jgi:anti-sigma regulatory factor (Ser/Thr protein kinase)
MFLMRRFMDEVTYDLSPPVGTIVRLLKRRV